MKKVVLLGLGLVLSCGTVHQLLAQQESKQIEKVGDKTFLIHQVVAGETLFGISKKYNVSVNELVQNNPQLQEGLKAGQSIRVPYTAPEPVATAVPAQPTPSATTVSPSTGSVKTHKVEQGETLFSISRKYGVSVADLTSWNKLKANDISVGQNLIVQNPGASSTNVASTLPDTPRKEEPKREVAQAAKPSAPAAESKPTVVAAAAGSTVVPGEWVTHTVEAGETLFSISRKYEAQVGDIISWNALSSNNVQVGQKLKVGRGAAAASTVPVVPAAVPVSATNSPSAVVSSVAKEGDTSYKNIKQTGLAEVIEGTGNHKKYLVLHRDAPIGTIMRVRNEENDITIFARVVGKLPETGDNSKLVIKLSKAAYDQLRAVNARFPVEISY